MNKQYPILLLAVAAGSLFFSPPSRASGAQLSFQLDPRAADGGTANMEVRIDPQSKNVNVVEGVITFQGAIANSLSVDVEASGSVLTVWPAPPTYSPGERAIRFTGGVPGGFDHEGLLFHVILSSAAPGSTTISWIGGSAYLNDGKGTAEPVSAKSITVTLDAQSPAPVSVGAAPTPAPSPVSGTPEQGTAAHGRSPAANVIIIFVIIVFCAAAAFIAFRHGKY